MLKSSTFFSDNKLLQNTLDQFNASQYEALYERFAERVTPKFLNDVFGLDFGEGKDV